MFFDKRLRNYLLTTVSAGVMVSSITAQANPLDPTVVTGNVAITGLGTDHVIVDNGSSRAIVDWDSFSIGTGEVTTINQISPNAAILNRVTGGDISKIYGRLESNGQVYLINENGILIGASGIVDTNGFVASTLNVSNTDFLGAGDMIFSQGIKSGGGITVHGKIRSVSGGDIFLLSREITVGETGEIDANGGYVGLGAGEEILLRPVDTGDGRISIRAGKGKIINRGKIAGIAAELRAAGGNAYALAINNTGVVRATGVSRRGGRILLTGGGKVRNSGKLVARRKVVIRSKKKIINSGSVKAGDGNKGGEIVFEAPEIVIEANSILDVSGALGGGRMFIGGGYQGSNVGHDGEAVDISANAQVVTVERGAVLSADATESGDGGEIVVWADDTTRFSGRATANALGANGDGGFIEISGKVNLTANGIVSAGAVNGRAGSVLFDPGGVDVLNIADADNDGIEDSADFDILGNGDADADGVDDLADFDTTPVADADGDGINDAFDAVDSTNEFGDDFIENILNGFTDGSGGVNLATGVTIASSGVGTGDVDFATNVSIRWTGPTLFEVNATGDINALRNVNIQNSQIGDGATTFVQQDVGGVRFLASGDINIGDATTVNAGLGTAIGSEFGENTFVAGDTDFACVAAADCAPEQAGDINLIGGDSAQNYAHLGFRVRENRGGNITGGGGSGEDFSAVGVHARNGTIRVRAGGNINLTAGTGGAAFAQIGHGGSTAVLQTFAVNGAGNAILTSLETANSGGFNGDVGEIAGNIIVIAGEIVSGDINMTRAGADNTGSIGLDYTQIGHGGIAAESSAEGVTTTLVHGAISGDISITIVNSDLNLNTAFTPSSDGTFDQVLAQVGHGGHLLYVGADQAGVEVTHGNIQGDITVDVTGVVNLGSDVAAAAGDDTYRIESQIGHGAHVQMFYDGATVVGAGDNSLDVVYGSIMSFTDITGNTDTTNISVTAGEFNIIAKETTQNSGGSTGLIFDNSQRSQIGHGMATFAGQPGGAFGAPGVVDGTAVIPGASGHNTQVETKDLDTVLAELAAGTIDLSLFSQAEADALTAFIATNTTASVPAAPGAQASVGEQLNISVTEKRIAGDITIIDDTQGMTAGILLDAGITGTLTKTDHDVMIARIGHASYSALNSNDGGDSGAGTGGFNGGNITVLQAHILGADINVTTQGVDADNQDISLITTITAGLASVDDNTAVAQIGHSGDIFAQSGDGGASTTDDRNSGDGGDITIVKGTVWDGGLTADSNGATGDNITEPNSTNITVTSSNQIIIDSETSAALASANRNNVEGQIGHGHRIRLDTGDGGTSTGTSAAGGAGGDVLVYQGVDVREYGIDNDQFDDYARGLRGDVTLIASEVDGTDGVYAIDITTDDTSALAATNFNSAYGLVGHSDIIEITTGDGGDGANGLDFEGDDNVVAGANAEDDLLGQVESYGGRGGHIEVQLGRYVTVDQAFFVDNRAQTLEGGVGFGNQADIGDSRALTLGGVGESRRQGVMLIESDIIIEVSGSINIDADVNNALSPSSHAISEAVIGHGMRVFADSGDGGNGGNGNFHANSEPVFESELEGEQYLNYESGQGTTRGGNGGDIRVSTGDITDRDIRDENGTTRVSHETDADRRDYSDITINISDSMDNVQLADSLIIRSAVNSGLAEGPGSDVVANVGHHVRLFAEGGKGGDGGQTNNEFDADGNSLLDDGTGQTDATPGADGVDETAVQAGAVYIQPNSSGGRGGDVFVVNNNINGRITVVADRRVTVETVAGHGLYGKVFSTIGHTTNLIAVTQNGGAAGALYEDPGANVNFDGGIVNVNGTQVAENASASSFNHVLVDGNQDDEFDLASNGDSNSTDGEDGIAVTPDDIANRTGSTIQSINTELGSYSATNLGGPNNDGLTTEGVRIFLPDGQNSVIFHDEEADPEFILDNDGNFVQNTESTNGLYASNAGNLARFGRVIATYDAFDANTDNELTSAGGNLFDARFATTHPDRRALQVFVDVDRDGDIDLVDFDRDGRLDIVDLDHDGFMDVIDGRANYVNSATYVQADTTGSANATPNGITGLGVLDYVAVTGLGFDAGHLEGGWSIDNTLNTTGIIANYNANNFTDFTSLVSDFSTANGGRGGDAYTQVGYTIGDISVSTGANDLGEANSLLVSVNLIDDVTGGGGDDYHKATIGHGAWQVSDSSANYAQRRSGREGIDGTTDFHDNANGGNAANFAIVGNGGRGGNANIYQGVERDYDPTFDQVSTDFDHLVGNIYINTPNALDMTISNDANRIEIKSFVDLDHGANVAIATIGHTAETFATAGNADIEPTLDSGSANTGGNGASDPGGEDGSSQTEIANGGDGGEATVHQYQVKGIVNVMTGADAEDGSFDYSLLLTAENGAAIVPPGPDNIIISQIGHGRRAIATGGDGGGGDDGQWQGNGGNGGNARIAQEAIIDTGITVDLVSFGPSNVTDPNGYFGNGMMIKASVFENSEVIVRAQVGNGDLARTEGGDGGNGSPDWNVNEQRNQSANGGEGGDGFIHQAAYAYDITLDIGHNSTNAPALDIVSSAANVNTGTDNHILASVGHGGLGFSVGGAGGNGGLSGAVNGIQTLADPNLVDSDYDYITSPGADGDTPYAIDKANAFVLGTLRRGGNGGDAEVNLNVTGTGRIITGRDTNNDYGINDINGADISIHTNDEFVAGGASFGYDGIRIRTENGPGSNQNSPLFLNSALVGHHGFGETVAGDGGDGIQSGLSALISEGDGGDGGTAITKVEQIWGDIVISNIGNPLLLGTLFDLGNDRATNILIETVSGTSMDNLQHRGEARVGHLTHVAATGGAGGDASREAGAPPAFPAIISAQGGDGGDAVTYQGQLAGDITVTAENSVIVQAIDTTSGNQMQVAAIGHRMEARAFAKMGGFGGTVVVDSFDAGGAAVAVTVSIRAEDADLIDNNGSGADDEIVTTVYTVKDNAGTAILCTGGQCFNIDALTGQPTGAGFVDLGFTTVTRPRSSASIYFIYEALREYHARRTAGAPDIAAFMALSGFEQQLVAPFTDYFENKPGELEIFLDKMIGDNANVIAANARDDDFVGGTDFTIPGLVDGDGHIIGSQDGELETLLHILAASGHGGNAATVQGTVGLDGVTTDELAASGNITLTANAYDTGDTVRGITLFANAAADGQSMELVQVGHQAESREVIAGNGQDLNGNNADANGIGGDGGDAIVDQYALNGAIDFNSEHEINITAQDVSLPANEVRAWVGHRLTVGPDYTVYRLPESVRSGDGGSESGDVFDDGRNGNGGDVFIWQRGVISGTQRDVSGMTTVRYDTEIQLVALQNSDNDTSITIEAIATGLSAPDVETHIGHDFLIHGVKAGDAGRQGALTGPVGASEGLLEGNGGDIFISQSDLGADIDIVGRDAVLIQADSVLGGNHAHLMIGHERTIGNSSETDNPRSGTIIAGFGGDAHIEDVNGTALASIEAAAAGIIEDADSGRIEIVLGNLGDSFEDNGSGGDDGTERLITITSLTEDVDVLATSATGSTSIVEIGNQQQVIAETLSASEYTGVPFVQTAGDAGSVYIARDDIYGDILIQALDSDRLNSLAPNDGKQVVINSTSGAGANSVTQIGHETEFNIRTSTPVTSRAAFGEDRSFLYTTNLTTFFGLGAPTVRDAQNAVEDMENLLKALDLALNNADRFPVDDGVVDLNDRGDLQRLRNAVATNLASANSALNSMDASSGVSIATAVTTVQSAALNAFTSATDFETVLTSIPQANEQIADFAEAGDIIYGDLTGKTLDIVSVRTIRSVMKMGTLTAEGTDVADTGVVRGNIDLLSGRYTGGNAITNVANDDTIIADNFGGTGFTTADDIDDGVVQITATADATALTEIGHRRVMTNTTSYGGGDTNAAPEEGGVAGDGGSITTKNFTNGDIRVRAEEIVINVAGGAGTGEVHFLHSSLTQNFAIGWSDIETLLGNGGDINNETVVSGGVDIAAKRFATAVDAQDRTIQAGGAANTFLHFGHQVADDNLSFSDNQIGGTGDTQDNLGSNRGGQIVSTQTVMGNAANDLVTISLDVNGDGTNSDLIIETIGAGQSDIRFGNGEDEDTLAGNVYHRGVSGANGKVRTGSPVSIPDDGDTVTLTQNVSGDIHISQIEDLEIKALGSADNDIWLGHDAEQFGQSGEANGATPQYGERVTVDQTVTGEIGIATTSTFFGQLGGGVTGGSDWHMGHEATQTAYSADNSANPSDFEDVDNNGVADGNGASSGGVNDSFAQPDIMATQLVQAKISIVTGEITLQNDGPGRLQTGHEAFQIASVDGELTDVNGRSTGHVVATSQINLGSTNDDDDIIFTATGATGQTDTVVVHVNGSQGDIQLVNAAAGEVQVGHRSESTMTDGPVVGEGQYNTLQAIGNSTDADGDGEIDDTSQSTIVFTAFEDITIDNQAAGTSQVGHYITENGTLQTNPVDVDGTAGTGLAAGDSELRQIVGSDIIFGDKSTQGSGGTGAGGAGNHFTLSSGIGRAMVGHMSPPTNQWQVEGTAPAGRRVTVQLLDGDITIEAGTDTDTDAPDGATPGSAAATVGSEDGIGDDILIVAAAGGVARVGHNQAGGTEGVNNETQASAGDIWVRAGGDLHVVGGAVGHENYDFTNPPSPITAPDNALPDSIIRDRIRGNTTIGAGQNSAPEDSTLIADVLVFDGGPQAVEINSSYGGQGDGDVDGELRFFLPAQEGLTVTPAVTFNDSASNGDAVPARTSNPGNVFTAEGGADHEHPFTFMDETAPYTDTFIGLGNYTFYFESVTASSANFDPEYTPYLNIIDLDGGYDVIFTDPKSGGTVNIGSLGGASYFGTSSFEVACEEQAADQGLDAAVCEQIREHHQGQPKGYGSNGEFSATAGGNQTFENQLNDDLEVGIGPVSSNFSYTVTPTSAVTVQGARHISAYQVTLGRFSSFGSHQLANLTTNKPAVTNLARLKSRDIVISFTSPIVAYSGSVTGTGANDLNDIYGEFIRGEDVNIAQKKRAYPRALSFASSYTTYQQLPL